MNCLPFTLKRQRVPVAIDKQAHPRAALFVLLSLSLRYGKSGNLYSLRRRIVARLRDSAWLTNERHILNGNILYRVVLWQIRTSELRLFSVFRK